MHMADSVIICAIGSRSRARDQWQNASAWLAGAAPVSTAGLPATCFEVTIKPHKQYQVEGKDVFLNLPVTPWEAALAARSRSPHWAVQSISISRQGRSGQKLRLKGRGLPVPKETAGDQFVVLQIACAAGGYCGKAGTVRADGARHAVQPTRAHLGG